MNIERDLVGGLRLFNLFLPFLNHGSAEVIDLTHPPTVALLRLWDQKEVAYIDLLRFIRISSSNPTSVVVSRPGKHPSVRGSHERTEVMEVDQNADGPPPVTSTAPPEAFSSTMMTMDEPIS